MAHLQAERMMPEAADGRQTYCPAIPAGLSPGRPAKALAGTGHGNKFGVELAARPHGLRLWKTSTY
jgi:hypothetical protein